MKQVDGKSFLDGFIVNIQKANGEAFLTAWFVSMLILETVIFWLISFPISSANFWAAFGSNVACNFKASSFPCNFAISLKV